MKIDKNYLKKQQKRFQFVGGGKFWRPKSGVEGEYKIRVFGFEHEITQEDLDHSRFPGYKKGDTIGLLGKEHFCHFVNGQTRDCLKEIGTCAYCEENIQQTVRFKLNVIPMDEGSYSMREYGAPKTVYDAISNIVSSDDYEGDITGCNGRDFKLIFDPAKANQYKYTIRLLDKGKTLPPKLQETVIDFYSNSETFDTEKYEEEKELEEPKKPVEYEEEKDEVKKEHLVVLSDGTPIEVGDVVKFIYEEEELAGNVTEASDPSEIWVLHPTENEEFLIEIGDVLEKMGENVNKKKKRGRKKKTGIKTYRKRSKENQ